MYNRVPCNYHGKNLSLRVEEFSKPPNYLAIKVLYQGGQTNILGAEVASVTSKASNFLDLLLVNIQLQKNVLSVTCSSVWFYIACRLINQVTGFR